MNFPSLSISSIISVVQATLIFLRTWITTVVSSLVPPASVPVHSRCRSQRSVPPHSASWAPAAFTSSCPWSFTRAVPTLPAHSFPSDIQCSFSGESSDHPSLSQHLVLFFQCISHFVIINVFYFICSLTCMYQACHKPDLLLGARDAVS